MTRNAENVHDAALGALLGACVGDAAGATLEFIGHKPTSEEVVWAMGMPGGGVIGVAPGQITDDGELTLCLARGLSKRKDFSLEQIAGNYAKWIESKPFDLGNTIALGFGAAMNPDWQRIYGTTSCAQAMRTSAAAGSEGSKANGSLMRATPLGIWGRQLDADTLADYARQDSSLSHPNRSCGDAVACYAIAIASLLRAPGDRQRAFDEALKWAKAHANQEIQQWLSLAERGDDIPYHPHIGFIKIGFVHAFRHLKLGAGYEAAISETLLGGGDTDTNACIVGGLIGAACGARAIPESLKEPVLSCDTSKGNHLPRPGWLHPKQVLDLVKNFIGV